MEWISTRQNTTLLRTSAFALLIRTHRTSASWRRCCISNEKWCWPMSGLFERCSTNFWIYRNLFWIMRSSAYSLGGCSWRSSGSMVFERNSESEAITSHSSKSSATWLVIHWCYGAISGEYALSVLTRISSRYLSSVAEPSLICLLIEPTLYS